MDETRDVQPRQALVKAAVGSAVAAGLVALLFGAKQGGVAWFLHLGRNWKPGIVFARQKLGPHVPVKYVYGHDGQFFWMLARDPLLLHSHVDKLILDRPVYRAQRIGYPLLAAPWRLFGEQALLSGLIVTNVVIVGLGTAETVKLARRLGAPDRAAIVFGLCPTVIVALIGDLGDALAVLLAVVAVRMVLERRVWAAALAFAAAALAKDSTLLVVAGVALAAVDLRRRDRALVAVVPAFVLGAWAVYERWRLGWASTHFLEWAWPVTAYVKGWTHSWSHGQAPGNFACAMLLWVALGVTAVRCWKQPSVIRAAAFAPCILVPVFSDNVISIALNSLRALGPALTFLGLDLYASAARRRRELAGAQA